MKNTITDYISSDSISNGLLIADMPTGYGKTYESARAMYDYIYKHNGEKKLFFITTLKKNLPIEELKNAYSDNCNKDFDKDVLVIKSNFDYINDNFFAVKIPDKFKMKSYYDLEKKLTIFNEVEGKRDASSQYIKDRVETEIREELEKNFRNDIINIIKNNFPKKTSKKIEKIRKDNEYKWIGELYPTVFMDDYKVYLLTIDKFLVKNTVLVEPSYYFINSEITNDSIIFFDEFDAGKDTIEKVLIDRALTAKHDYIKLFLQIYNAFRGHVFSGDLMRLSAENKENEYSFRHLKEEAEELFNSFELKYNYKTLSEGVDKKQSFLFNDNSYHTMLRNNCNYIRATLDKENSRVNIYFENKQDYYNNRKDDDIIIYSLVRKISSFLTKFRFMILTLATAYANHINESRHSKEDEFTIENAMKTLYREFSLTQSQISLLMNELCNDTMVKSNIKSAIPDMSFYNNGFKYFEFEDSDNHLNETSFNYVDIYDTPEKIIVYLGSKAKVIGISATGTIKTVTGNYDLNYLENKLKDMYMKIPQEVYKKIEAELEEIWKTYSSGKIKINTSIVNYNKGHLSMEERLKELFEKSSLVRKYENILRLNAADEEHVWKRYCNVFAAIKGFVIHDDIKSFLCLNMVLPKTQGNKSNFDLDIFKEALEDLAKLYEKEIDKRNISILRSEHFDEDKEEILDRLSQDKKVFIMSSYKTIGAGQNLQYRVDNIDRFIKIAEVSNENDSRVKNKDIDAVFLGDITNLAVNIFNEATFDKYNLLKYFLQIEYLYENDEISYKTLDDLIKLGFRKYSKSEENSGKYKELSKSKSIKRQATRDVMQAIGRMCRTYIKNPNIYIYTVEELTEKVDTSCLEGKILSPEMKAFVELVDSLGYKYSDEETKVLNRAERISSKGKNFIMKILSRGWSDDSISLWKRLRKTVLKYPVANVENYNNDDIVRNLYIQAEEELNKYLYAQKGDFSDVVIDFKNDRVVFANSIRCEDRNVAEVSEEEARLSAMLNYRGLKDYFKENGYALQFGKEKYILSPVLFNNIYKGALGEEVGKFILENELGIRLNEIEVADKFEFFDFEISEGVYIDFKHWKRNYRQEKTRDEYKVEIENKLEQINGKRVYIINILSNKGFSEHMQKDGRIIEIPCLLDEDGTSNIKALELLKEEILGDNK
jgi:hypothetical protein